jgi:hypothetical protein
MMAACGAAEPAVAPEPVLAAAKEYPSCGRVHDRLLWAPTLCKAPTPAPPRLSASRDGETHGQTLDHLYARHFDLYRQSDSVPQPVGQVLVKESWIPALGSTRERPLAGEKGPLFLMLKTGAPGRDGGWIYATLTPDGQTITASGKMASCMECHESKRERLFGIKSCAGAEELSIRRRSCP